MKVLFFVDEFVGPQNACIGLGQALQRRDHQVYFCLTEQFREKFKRNGFSDQCLLSLRKKDDGAEKPTLKMLVEKILQTGFANDGTPLEKVKSMPTVNVVKDIMEDPVRHFNGQIHEYLIRIDPDLIVVDIEVIPPCILTWTRCPWIYLFCSNPIGLFDSDQLPPFLSDFPTESDPESWKEFRETLEKCYFRLVRDAQRRVFSDLSYGEWTPDSTYRFIVQSPYLNLYQFPECLDYHDRITISEKYFRVDTFCREEIDQPDDETFSLSDRFNDPNRPLIYLSLGSMGSCNLDLMRRLIGVLTDTPYNYVVSKGPLGDQLQLPSGNMYGQPYVPQIRVLKMVSAAIIHGGNNSLTEAIQFGLPVLVLPLFYDQFLNAQRVQEKGIGIRLDTFHFTKHELLDAVDRLIHDQQLRKRVSDIGQQIRSADLKNQCCKKLEQIADNFKIESDLNK